MLADRSFDARRNWSKRRRHQYPSNIWNVCIRLRSKWCDQFLQVVFKCIEARLIILFLYGSCEGGTVVDVPRCNADGFKIDVEAIQRAVYKHKPKLLFLTSPNNPDGCVLSDRELLLMLELPVLVVLDEAYIEFASCKSHIADVVKYDNLIVLRTFSKCAALAGFFII